MAAEINFICDRCGFRSSGLHQVLEGQSRLPKGWKTQRDPRTFTAPSIENMPSYSIQNVELCEPCSEIMAVVVNSAANYYSSLIKQAFEDPNWRPDRQETDEKERLKERQKAVDGL